MQSPAKKNRPTDRHYDYEGIRVKGMECEGECYLDWCGAAGEE